MGIVLGIGIGYWGRKIVGSERRTKIGKHGLALGATVLLLDLPVGRVAKK